MADHGNSHLEDVRAPHGSVLAEISRDERGEIEGLMLYYSQPGIDPMLSPADARLLIDWLVKAGAQQTFEGRLMLVRLGRIEEQDFERGMGRRDAEPPRKLAIKRLEPLGALL